MKEELHSQSQTETSHYLLRHDNLLLITSECRIEVKRNEGVKGKCCRRYEKDTRRTTYENTCCNIPQANRKIDD